MSSDASSRREWFEIAAVVAVAVVPDLVYALESLTLPDAHSSPILWAINLIVRAVQVSVPTLYIISRSPEGFAGFGIERLRVATDLGFGLFLGAVGFFVSAFVAGFLAGWTAETSTSVAGWFALDRNGSLATNGLAMSADVANGFAEELAMRAFLITRLEKRFQNTWTAIAVSAVLFGSYHVYQGFGGAITILVVGILYGCAYAYLRRLAPLAIGHALTNLAIGFWYGGA